MSGKKNDAELTEAELQNAAGGRDTDRREQTGADKPYTCDDSELTDDCTHPPGFHKSEH